jgi:CubicO group peptidase (beta-lactamase class C family)
MDNRRKPEGHAGIWRLLGIAFAIWSCFASGCALAPEGDDPGRERLSAAMRKEFQDSGLPGMACALLMDDAAEWIGCYGCADVEDSRPVSPETLFQIASVSKLVTGAAMMRACEQGLLDLDEDVSDVVGMPVRNPAFPQAGITPRMLLSHTSSIDNNWDLYESLYTIASGGGDSPISLSEFCEGFLLPGGEYFDAAKNFRRAEPGGEFSYSNTGYALAGFAVERASGMPFAEYCAHEIFEPAGIANATWFHAGLPEGALAIPYSKGKRLPPYSFPSWPDGALKISIVDFSAFFLDLMEGAEDGGPEAVTRAGFADMSDMRYNGGKQGLALSSSVLSDLWITTKSPVLGHSGGDPGIFTIAFYSPEKRSGGVLFSNGDVGFDLGSLHVYRILKMLVEASGV